MPVNTGLFKSLNKAQCRAVTSPASTVAILAGPGSGKTHTLTSRVVWLVDHMGYQPHDIIVATFTVKAAREMKERIGKALGNGREKNIILGTFHSIARRYLASYGQKIGLDPKFGIADDSDSRGIITRICKRLDVQIDPPVARAWISKKKAKGTANDETKPQTAKTVESQAFETCYEEYQKHLDRSNLLDYDDLLVRCVELLRNCPSCVSNVQSVLIDEYQDTNGVQYELMKLFAQRNQRITIVGDPDQSIYGWRSAEIRNLHRFLRDFAGTDEVSLEENYRSSSSILDVSLKVIQQDKKRYQKVLLPVHNKATRPVLRKLKNPMDEADWIVSEIKRVKMMSGDMVTSDDIVILLRSAYLSRHIESALGKAGMAYKMVGGFKFYERIEIKILLDYLRVVHQPDNNDSLARIMNVPKRGIGDGIIKSLLEEAERNSMSLWTLLTKHCRGDRTAKTPIRKQTEQKISGDLLKIIKRLRDQASVTSSSLVDLIEQLLNDLHFEKFLEDTHGADHESRWSNVREFVGLAGEFEKDQSLVEEDALPEIEGLKQRAETDVLARFLANVSLASDKQTDDQDHEGKPVITVSTIHAAKGLEWPIVFIPAVYQGSIPHMRSDDEAEERRLLYVAMTRAKALLYLSCPLYSAYGNRDSFVLSPFVKDISSTHFLNKGPSFDRRHMMEVAMILQRELPPEKYIYGRMPPMSAVEDNLFPIDPNEPKQMERSNSSDVPNAAQHRKRQKTQHTSSTAKIAPESVEGWNVPYATTMEQTSYFTLPGFTTAGAHHVANPPAPPPPPPPRAGPPAARRYASNRPPAQRSLLGYCVKNHDNSHAAQAPQPPQELSRPQQSSHRPASAFPRHHSMPLPLPQTREPQAPAINPALSNHRLGSAKLATKPTSTTKQTQPGEDGVGAKRAYSCFSSSPGKPSPDSKKVIDEKGAAAEEEPVLMEDRTRPAACFHATTTVHANSVRHVSRGIKKPDGLGRDGITPMDRLRKPFKPLTINRQ